MGIVDLTLDLDLVADLKAHRTPGGCTMASPMTLHISRPCHMRCTPQALDRPSPAHDIVNQSVGRRGGMKAAWARLHGMSVAVEGGQEEADTIMQTDPQCNVGTQPPVAGCCHVPSDMVVPPPVAPSHRCWWVCASPDRKSFLAPNRCVADHMQRPCTAQCCPPPTSWRCGDWGGGGAGAGGSICAVRALRCTFTAGLPGMGCLLPPPKMPPKESKLLGTRTV